MLNVSIVKMGKYYGDSYVRYDGEIIDSDPESEEEISEYYNSLLEMGDGIFTSLGDMSLEPTKTSQVYMCSHQSVRTVKKTNKKKSMEQRAKQKVVRRLDLVPDHIEH